VRLNGPGVDRLANALRVGSLPAHLRDEGLHRNDKFTHSQMHDRSLQSNVFVIVHRGFVWLKVRVVSAVSYVHS
jgi:hypothetical protein